MVRSGSEPVVQPMQADMFVAEAWMEQGPLLAVVLEFVFVWQNILCGSHAKQACTLARAVHWAVHVVCCNGHATAAEEHAAGVGLLRGPGLAAEVG